jgi:hypothetical protein
MSKSGAMRQFGNIGGETRWNIAQTEEPATARRAMSD